MLAFLTVQRLGRQRRKLVIEIGLVEMRMTDVVLNQIVANLMEFLFVLCGTNDNGRVIRELIQIESVRCLNGGVARLDGLLWWREIFANEDVNVLVSLQ